MLLSRAASVDGSRTIEGGGKQWIVREVSWPGAAGPRGTCLIFENDAVVRRVRRVPDDWRTCSDEALYDLSLSF